MNPNGTVANLLRRTSAASAAAWHPQKIARLTFLVQAGMHSFSEIGEIMGIGKNAVIGKAHRLNLKGPRMRGPDNEPSTLNSRLDALHAELDAVLARARPAPVVPKVVTDNATRPMQRAAR